MTAIVKECYELIQELSILFYPICSWPGCSKPSTVGHHLFKRDRMATAFSIECVWGMCHDHHGAVHDRKRWFAEYVYTIIGERYYELQRLSNTTAKYIDFRKVRDDLKKQIKMLSSYTSSPGDPLRFLPDEQTELSGKHLPEQQVPESRDS